MQAMVRLVPAEPIVEELLVEGLDDRRLVGFAQLHTGILIVQGFRAQRLEIGGVAHRGGLDGRLQKGGECYRERGSLED